MLELVSYQCYLTMCILFFSHFKLLLQIPVFSSYLEVVSSNKKKKNYYRLSNLPLKDYDPVLNKKYLLECMKWYLSCCDTIAKTCGEIDHLTGFLSNLRLNGKDRKNKLVNDKVLMESLYILCNLDDLHPLYRYVNLSKEFKR